MAHETAQILGVGCRVLFHNGILYRIQAQVISRQQSSKKVLAGGRSICLMSH